MTDTRTVSTFTPKPVDFEIDIDIIEPRTATSTQPVSGLTKHDAAVHIAANGLSLFVVFCVGLLVFLFAGTSLLHSRAQRSLRAEFANLDANLLLPPQPTTDANGTVTGIKPIATGSPVAVMTIPRIGVDEIVVQGTNSSTTLHGPGHVQATPLPGQYGNAVVIGRRNTAGSPFGDLDTLRNGDAISFVVSTGRVHYRVTSVRTTGAGDTSIFATQGAAGQRRNTVTLVTTGSFLGSDRRVVVQGDLVGTAQGFSPGRIAARPDELGLAGERGALLPLLLCLQLLLAASIGAAWLSKRWHRYAAWTVATPIVLCAAWLVFEQFARVLPAAL